MVDGTPPARERTRSMQTITCYPFRNKLHLHFRRIRQYCQLDETSNALMRTAMNQMQPSKILRSASKDFFTRDATLKKI